MSAEFRTGVDIMELDRIEKAVARWGDRFLLRIYTPGELAYCRGRINSLAGRWAAKEAIMKALGTGWSRGIRWIDLEVVRLPGGPPTVDLHGLAQEYAEAQGIQQWSLSLSHSRDYAVAFALAW